jgi:hypothetical protein
VIRRLLGICRNLKVSDIAGKTSLGDGVVDPLIHTDFHTCCLSHNVEPFTVSEVLFRNGLIDTFENVCKITIHSDFRDRPFAEPLWFPLSSSSTITPAPYKSRESVPLCMFARGLQNTRQITLGLYELFFIKAGIVFDSTVWYKFMLEWFLIYLQGRFAKCWKVQTVNLFCMVTGQWEKAEYKPDDIFPLKEGYIGSGRMYRCLRNLGNLPINRRLAFFFSLMQCKRCAVSFSNKEELASLQKHRSNMQGGAFLGKTKKSRISYLNWRATDTDWSAPCPDPIVIRNVDNLNDDIVNVNKMVDLLVRTTIPAPKGNILQFEDKELESYESSLSSEVEWRSPSINSTFTHGRRQAGAQGSFFQRINPLFNVDYFRTFLIGFISFGTRVFELRCSSNEDPQSSVGIVEELYDNVQNNYHAQVQTILEPLKARIITSGPAQLYHWARMYQKYIHSKLKRYPTFHLIGQPNRSETLTEHLRGVKLKEGWYWVSGDYDAATDGLCPSISKQYCNSVSDQMGFSCNERQLCYKAMCEHIIHYPEWSKLDPVYQNWGQLMGSPKSFPALCVANAASFWLAVEEFEGKRIRFDELIGAYGLLINGDDIIFKSNDKLQKIWRRITTNIGLTPSIGKNFQSRDWFTINSRCYRVTYSGKFVSTIADISHLDCGLIQGISKVQGDTRLDSDLEVEAQLLANIDKINQCTKYLPEGESTLSYDAFMFHNMKMLKESPRSWILPQYLGGLGIKLPFSDQSISIQQKLVAGHILEPSRFNTSLLSIPKPKGPIGNSFGKILNQLRFRSYRAPLMGVINGSLTKTYSLPDVSRWELSNERIERRQKTFSEIKQSLVDRNPGYLGFLNKIDWKSVVDMGEVETPLLLTTPVYSSICPVSCLSTHSLVRQYSEAASELVKDLALQAISLYRPNLREVMLA